MHQTFYLTYQIIQLVVHRRHNDLCAQIVLMRDVMMYVYVNHVDISHSSTEGLMTDRFT